MNKKLCKFWKEHSTEEHSSKIKEVTDELVTSLKFMNKRATAELVEKWKHDSKLLQNSALSLMNLGEESKLPEEHWAPEVLGNIAQALAYNNTIKIIETRTPAQEQLPPRGANESAAEYKARLHAYIDTTVPND